MKKSVLFLLLVFISPLLVFSGGQSEAVSATSVTGLVEYFDGDVTINEVPADFGMKVPFGAIVETGPDSYCEIVFERKNIFRIQESTLAEIRLSITNPEITIRKGAFAALFNKLDSLTHEQPFKVKTQAAAAGVRGTAFFVKVLDENSTYICICNGELDVANPAGRDIEPISSGHHKAMYFRNIDGKFITEKAPLLYHNDKGMEALASHIEENIDWYY